MSIDGWKGLFAGDTAYHDGYAEVGERFGPFDFAMIPIGAYAPRWFMHVVHADPDEAVQMLRELALSHPDAPLPLTLGIHWGTFRLTDEPMRESHLTLRLLAVGLATITLSVLVLAAAGIYALMSVTVTQRRREIGIRMALGAGTRTVLSDIFRLASMQLGAGIAAGIGLSVLMDLVAHGALLSGKSVVFLSTEAFQ